MGAFISGYKTYGAAIAAGVTIVLQQLGILTDDQSKALLEGFGALMAVFIRMGIAKAATVSATNLAVTTGTVSPAAARAVSIANPIPAPPNPATAKEL